MNDLTDDNAALAIMGPRSRQLLETLSAPLTFSDMNTPVFSCRDVLVAGVKCRALRVSFIGELGWELHMPAADAGKVYDALFDASESQGLGLLDAGTFSLLESLRMEKMFVHYGHEISPCVSPREAGLTFALKLKTDVDFIGRDAIECQRQEPLSRRLVTVTAPGTDVSVSGGHGAELILRNGMVVGHLTSGGYSHTLDCPFGLGYVEGENITQEWLRSGQFELEVSHSEADGTPIISRVPALVTTKALFDPKGERMRGIYPGNMEVAASHSEAPNFPRTAVTSSA